MDRKTVIGQRLAALPEVDANARKLGSQEVDALLDLIERVDQQRRLVMREDFSGSGSSRLHALLVETLPPIEERCKVIWPWEREGIEIARELVVRYIDDLWYPASDDIWITGFKDSDWMVHINHEELIELWSSRF